MINPANIVLQLEAKAAAARVEAIDAMTDTNQSAKSSEYLIGQADAYSDAAETIKRLVASINHVKTLLGI